MFGWLRKVWYLITFQFSKASDKLALNPGVMSATYDNIIKEKKNRINIYKDAIAGLVAQEQTKKDTLVQLTADVQRLEKLKAGAIAKANTVKSQIASKMLGSDDAQIKAACDADQEYQKCLGAFRDFTSTLKEKQTRITELEGDVANIGKTVATHKVGITGLMRELEKIKTEKYDAVGEVMSAQEQKQVADILNNLAEDTTSNDLQNMRELRQKARAGAKVSQELAGLDTKQAEDEFLDAVNKNEADDEFAAALGFKDTAAKTVAAPVETKLPE